MKVKAKHNIIHDGVYHKGLSIFEVTEKEFKEISDFVTVEEDEKDPLPTETVEEKPAEEAPKQSKKKSSKG